MLRKFILLILLITFSSSFVSPVFGLSQEEEHYGKIAVKWNPMEHFLINGAIGGLTVGIWGYTAAYSQYSATNESSLEDAQSMMLGIGMLTGIGSSIAITIFEQNHSEAFTLGKRLWAYGWYGAVFGGLTGVAVGLIPYRNSSHKDDKEELKNYGGYGVIIGVPVGILLFFVYEEAFPDYGKSSGIYKTKLTSSLVYNNKGQVDGISLALTKRF